MAKSVFGFVLNFINAAVGAGILAIPAAFKESGLIGGLACAIILVVLMIRSAQIIIRKCSLVESPQISYQSLVDEFLGKKAATFVSASVILYLYGVSIGLFIIVGQQLQDVMRYFCGHGTCSDRRLWIVIFTTVFCFPWTLMPSIDRLQAMGLLSSCSCAYVLILGVVKSILHLVNHGVHDIKLIGSVGLFRALPVFCFAYQLHLQVPLVYGAVKRWRSGNVQVLSLPPPTLLESQRLVDLPGTSYGARSSEDSTMGTSRNVASRAIKDTNSSLVWALFSCYILYSGFGAAAFLNFGDSTQSDVLKNYREDDKLVVVARIAIALTAGVSYPINLFPGRLALMDILSIRPSPKYFYLLTIAWHFSAVGISLFVDDLGVVFQIIGATVGVVVIFIIPAMLVLWPKTEGSFVIGQGDTMFQVWEARFLVLVGMMIGIMGVVFVFVK
eukprot:c5026_g1_i1.p1 GENE.c5026_g1_i1~~c5026_g1_i1.p1  ORF type:complete len:455 (+),score=80.17 c5026_g1_i1:39-1367(+)